MENGIAARSPSGFILPLPALVSKRRYAQQVDHLLLRQCPTPEIRGLWEDLLRRVKFPDLYTTPHLFSEPYWKDKKTFAILAMHDGQVTGVLTGLDEGDQVTCGIPSRPQLQIDPDSETQKAAQILAKALVSEFPNARVTTAYSWSGALAPEFEAQHFRVRQLGGVVVLDLDGGAEALFKSFHDTRKRNIRAAIRNGVQVSEVETDQDLTDYWDVFCAWRKTRRKKIHYYGNFEKAAEVHRLRATHRRFLARYKGKAIAATTVRFCPGGLIEYSANCSIDEFNRLRPNDLLIWKTIQWACENGFSRYSLGSSHPFLRKCGGVVVPTYRYRLDRTFLRQIEMSEKVVEIGRHLLYTIRWARSVVWQRFKKVRLA